MIGHTNSETLFGQGTMPDDVDNQPSVSIVRVTAAPTRQSG